jgi:hypothetical protein
MSVRTRLKRLFQPGQRRFLLPIALGIVVLAILGYWLYTVVAPSFPCSPTSVPGGSAGTECLNGVRFAYASYAIPTAGQTTNVEFHGVAFSLANYAAGSSGGSLVVNGTEPGGFQFDLTPTTGTVVSGWLTAVAPDHSFGAQLHGAGDATVRLLVSDQLGGGTQVTG